ASRERDLLVAGHHKRQAQIVSKIAPLRPLQRRSPNPPRAPLHARPIWGIGYSAGLETYAAQFSLAFLRCVSACSRHAAIAKIAVRPSQGVRSRNVTIIVALS